MELAFAMAPEWWYGAYVLAVTCKRGKERDERYLLQGAAHRGPAEAHSVRVALADLHLRLGLLDRAEAGYGHLLHLDPTSRAALAGLARVAEKRQDWEKGAIWLKKALYYGDSDVQSRWLLAGLTERAGDLSGAEEHLRYLAQHGPARRGFIVELWRFYLRHGREGVVRALGPSLRQRDGVAGSPGFPVAQFPLSGTP
jgi:tetratricopeptide (TPR) repeat protein